MIIENVSGQVKKFYIDTADYEVKISGMKGNSMLVLPIGTSLHLEDGIVTVKQTKDSKEIQKIKEEDESFQPIIRVFANASMLEEIIARTKTGNIEVHELDSQDAIITLVVEEGTIKVHRTALESLSIEGTVLKLNIAESIAHKEMDLNYQRGRIKLNQVKSRKLNVVGDTKSSCRLKQVIADNIDVQIKNGSVSVTDLSAQNASIGITGSGQCEVKQHDVSNLKVQCGNVPIKMHLSLEEKYNQINLSTRGCISGIFPNFSTTGTKVLSLTNNSERGIKFF